MVEWRKTPQLIMDGVDNTAPGQKQSFFSVLPAALNLAVAYIFNVTTFEFVFERTFWGANKELDFNFDSPLNSAVLTASFDDPVSKNWNDSNTYMFGITHHYNSNLALMAGFAVDQSPVPADTLGFDLPDADGLIYSGGIKYDYNEKITFGLSYLYLKKNKRSVSNNDSSIVGDFSSSAHLLNFSLSYFF